MSKILLTAATMTMVLSIIFGATGNTNLMYALTAFAGAETILRWSSSINPNLPDLFPPKNYGSTASSLS